MTHRPEATPTDDGLEGLLQVERRLDALVQEAERRARARVDAAREAARRDEKERGDGVEAMARAEEAAELERHAEQLRQIAADGVARVGRLSAVAGSVVEQLALRAVAAVLARKEAGRP